MAKTKQHILRKLLILSTIIATLITSCVEEFWPDLDNNKEKILVVKGKITNQPGPYTIYITKTGNIDSVPYSIEADFDLKGISGAMVSIIDEAGNTEILTETEAGIYQTAADGIQGIVGNSYKLTITTSNGIHYESNFQKLLPPIEIDTIKFAEETVSKYIDNQTINQTGLKFYISSEAAGNENKYVYWEVEDTYEYHAQYPIEQIFNGTFKNGVSHPHPPFNIPKLANPDSLFYCYKTGTVYQLFSYNLNELETPKVIDYPLTFVSYDSEKLEFKYSLNVKQYSVNKDAQDYIRRLTEQNSNQDGLYSSQPYLIRGNIKNIDDENEAVLGFFMAASYAKMKHAFYKAPEKQLYPDTFVLCKPLMWDPEPPYEQGVETSLLKYLKYIAYPNQYPIYLTHAWVCINCDLDGSGPPPAFRIYAIRYAAVDDPCVDCRLREHKGTIKKPEFWIWDK